MTVLQTAGLSHSEIPGSEIICIYPGLIAAYHVLRRLCEPRHPPYALSYFLRKTLKETKRIYLFLSQVFAHTFSCQVKYKSHDLISNIELMFYFTVLLVSICQRSFGQLKGLKPSHVTCVENNGFEPLTPCLQSRCSSQLS